VFGKKKKSGHAGGAVSIRYGTNPTAGGESFVMEFDSPTTFLSFDERSLVGFIASLEDGLETIRGLKRTRASGGVPDAAR